MTVYASRHFVAGDRPLRRDIRLLGRQLRRLIREHGGEALWDRLWTLRQLIGRHRTGDEEAQEKISALIAAASPKELAELARAMGLVFDLANLAEDRHRVRVLQAREAEGRASETIGHAAAALRDDGLDETTIGELLDRLEVEPVLTAHPTEAKRRGARRALRRLRRELALLERPGLSRVRRGERLDRMQRDLASLWYTDPVSPRKPSVMEELDRTLFAVDRMWRVGPRIMNRLRNAFPEHIDTLNAAPPLRFGNWIGGDRDGNPFVTTAVTRRTLETLRETALRYHRHDCRRARQRLTVSSVRCELGDELRQRIDAARDRWQGLAQRLDSLHPDEWIVQWLTVIEHRLRRSHALPDAEPDPSAYRDAAELEDDVSVMDRALRRAGHDELTGGALRRWRDRIAIFGLHLLRLDVRVNSTLLHRAVTAIAQQLGGADEPAALFNLQHETIVGLDLAAMPDDVADLLDLLAMLQRLHARGGGAALGPIVISMTHKPGDVLAMIGLLEVTARRAGLDRAEPLPISPLFETIDDLDRAQAMLEALLADPAYRQHVRRGGDHQVCMIGYSDSAKDGGYLASNWALYQTQRRLAACAKEHGVTLTIFHGRGGALGRGGGPAARAIRSLPPEAVDGRLRITEQGEVIAERYDDPAIAHRHLEQLFWATLKQFGPHHRPPVPEDERFARQLAEASMAAYRRLIERPGFADYVRQCTTLPLIEGLPIGSRPSRRSASGGLNELRAIPFTFAWNQVRMPINAFYGLGAAFESLDDDQRERAIALYRDWPWFRAIINNAELALARCDPAITCRYTALARDRAAAESLWEQLRDEHAAAHRAVLAIKREGRLLEAVPWLDRTVAVRTPYLDLLNMIQVDLMTRRADTGAGATPESDPMRVPLRLTVQALAAGLRNTG